MGPQYIIAQNILENLGILTPEEALALKAYHDEDITNYAKLNVGKLQVSSIARNFGKR